MNLGVASSYYRILKAVAGELKSPMSLILSGFEHHRRGGGSTSTPTILNATRVGSDLLNSGRQ